MKQFGKLVVFILAGISLQIASTDAAVNCSNIEGEGDQCISIYTTYIGNVDDGVVSGNLGNAVFHKNTTYLTGMCNVLNLTAECLTTLGNECKSVDPSLPQKFQDVIKRSVQGVRYHRMCKDLGISPNWTAIIEKHNIMDATCYGQSSAIKTALDEISAPFFAAAYSYKNWTTTDGSDSEIKRICKLYSFTASGIGTAFATFKSTCNQYTRRMWPCGMIFGIPGPIESLCAKTMKSMCQPPKKVNRVSTKRATVGAFGDPHLLVYQSNNTIVTCSAEGTQMYVGNEYLYIGGENTLVKNGSTATAITTLTVAFFDPQDLSKGAVVNVTIHGSLPDVLPDGDARIDIGSYSLTYQKQTDKRGRTYVIIRHLESNSFLFLRMWKNFISFIFRSTEDLFDNSQGILITGCPDEIDVTTEIQAGRRRKRNADCNTACSGLGNQCLYDCTVTGDTSAAEMSQDYQSDNDSVESMDSEATGGAAYMALSAVLAVVLTLVQFMAVE